MAITTKNKMMSEEFGEVRQDLSRERVSTDRGAGNCAGW